MLISEFFGWFAMVLTLASFMVNDMFKLRVINSIGSIFWIVYGVQTESYPTIIVNVCILIIHSVWLIKNKLWKKKN